MAKTAAAAKSGEGESASGGGAPAKSGTMKLVVIVIGVVLVAAIGVGGMLLMKKKSPAADHDEEAESAQAELSAPVAKVDLTHPPVFVPLEPFIVNLADKESDRYAQIAVTLQVGDPKFAEQVKAFMPAVRNSILMLLAHKTSQELLERAGKEVLAEEIMYEAALAMGLDVEPIGKESDDSAGKAGDESEPPKKRKKAKRRGVVNPIQHVHFSNFIIQ